MLRSKKFSTALDGKAFEMVPGYDPNTDELEESKQKMIAEDRAFFCSELVVKALKCCGIL